MNVAPVEATEAILREVIAHAEREYPKEACGLIFAPRDACLLTSVVPLKNVQDRYHALDPNTFPRSSRQAFRLDEMEHLRALEKAEAQGLCARVLYHSHVNVGAYFSDEDRAMAVREGVEMMPGMTYWVLSIVDGRYRELAAFRFESTQQRFVQIPVQLTTPAPSPTKV